LIRSLHGDNKQTIFDLLTIFSDGVSRSNEFIQTMSNVVNKHIAADGCSRQ